MIVLQGGIDIMLKKFTVENYKNFLEPVTIDFCNVGGYQFNTNCLCDDYIGKMLVYGRNGTGKTNLCNAIIDIAISSVYLINNESNSFLNADSKNESAKFSYVFQFAKNELEYTYEKSSMAQYSFEALLLNGIEIFRFDYIQNTYSYENLNLISAETIVVERFLESKNNENIEGIEAENSISFLRWIFGNAVFSNESPILELRSFINRMRASSISTLNRAFMRKKDAFFDSLLNKNNLSKLEEFLNDMGVNCKLESKKLPDGQIELYFKYKRLIPFFENASSGTIVLFNLYRRLVTSMKNMSFCYMDEFDAFFHYEMSERFLNYFKEKFPNCQMVFTTHNTNLMANEIMRPDCIFILSQKGELTPLNRATTRELREGHNLEKMYISGEFDRYE